MALDDVKHVEVVAILRAVIEQPAAMALPVELRETIGGWLTENHPVPSAYMAAMRSMVMRSMVPNCGCANDCRYASRTGSLPDGVICRDGRHVPDMRERSVEIPDGMKVVEGWVVSADVPDDTVRRMLRGREQRGQSMPLCPVCFAPAVESKAQTVTRVRAAMAGTHSETGQIAYRCANGHYHDGQRETGPAPEDITIREGL
jgi:hypothetical protein